MNLSRCASFFSSNFLEFFFSLARENCKFLRSRATIPAWFRVSRYLAKCAHARQSCANHYAIPGATRWRSIFISSQSGSSFLCVRARWRWRRRFVTFYEISTLAVVEFISSPAAMGGKEGEDGDGCWLFSRFFLLIIVSSRERGSRLALP